MYQVGRLLLYAGWTKQTLDFPLLLADSEYELHVLAFDFARRNRNRVLSFEFKTAGHFKAGLITLETKRFRDPGVSQFESDEVLSVRKTIAEVTGCPESALSVVELPFNGTVDLSDAQDIFPREQFSFALFPQIYWRRFRINYLDTGGAITQISTDAVRTAPAKVAKILSLDSGENYYEQFWNGAVEADSLKSKELHEDPDSRFAYFPFNIFKDSPPKVSLQDEQEFLPPGVTASTFRLELSPLETLFVLDSKWRRIYQQVPNLLSVEDTAKHYGNYGYFDDMASLPEFSLPSKIFIAKNHFASPIPKVGVSMSSNSKPQVLAKNSASFSPSVASVTSFSSEILNPLTAKKFNFLIGVYEPPIPNSRAPPEVVYSLGTHFHYNASRNLISVESINSFLSSPEGSASSVTSEKDVMVRVTADAKGFVYSGIFDVESILLTKVFVDFYRQKRAVDALVPEAEVVQSLEGLLDRKEKELLDTVVGFIKGHWKPAQIIHFLDFRDKIMNRHCKGVVLDVRKPIELYCNRVVTKKMFLAVTILGSPNVYSSLHLAPSDSWDFQFFIVEV